ncbi:MAG: formate transporter [Methanocella sp. PtaU1.Bin125]|nr:MAG: formate transporter [Methanocella sp. PtaU1.Bin125]
MPFKPPADIAKAAINSGCTKCTTTWDKLLILAFLAGAYIAFGALLAEIVAGGLSAGLVQTAADGTTLKYAMPTGLLKFATGAVFPVGLCLVVIAGSELFTGNCMFAPIAWLDKKITIKGFVINWTLVYIGNLIGSLFVAYCLAYWSGLFSAAPFAPWAMSVANGKMALTMDDAFLRGIGCNWLVCLAVWLAIAADDVVSKMLACWFPIMAFVTIGFEHSVANMFFIPLGIALANDSGITSMAGINMALYPKLGAGLAADWVTFIVNNLIPVTIGNIVGAAVFVAAIYWWVYIRSPLCIATPAKPATAPTK